jgi:hypothetical protein
MWLKKVFNYIEPLWLGKDNRISLRSAGAMALIVDFVINMHNSAGIVTKVLNLYMIDKSVDPAVIAAMSGNMAQIGFMLITEATLIAALLALRTWQTNKEGFTSTSINVTSTGEPAPQTIVTTAPAAQSAQPVEQLPE